jgi:NADH-quinone oxidoreductase subunit H
MAASSAGAAEPVPWLAWLVWLVFGFAVVFPLVVAYIVWGERKSAARFQDRIGPNRVGPLGLLQPIADVFKLVIKEDFVPGAADKFIHAVAPVLMLVSAMLALAVIPFGFGSVTMRTDPISGVERLSLTGFSAVDLPSGVLYLIAVSSMASLGLFLAGWSSRNKYALLGSMRSVAQMVSYEIPQVLATVPIVLWAGSLSLATVLDRQVESGWFLFSPPGFVAFAVYLIASLAEVNRTPFDLPEAESELIAGYHTEYSSMRFGLFFLAEYMAILAVTSVGTSLFLGGGGIPFTTFPRGSLGGSAAAAFVANLITIAVFALKVAVLVFVVFWVRATLPRMRVDRLMAFAWKFLIPVSLANILIAAVWFEIVLRHVPVGVRAIGTSGWWVGFGVTAVLELAAVLAARAVYRVDAAREVESRRRVVDRARAAAQSRGQVARV